MYVVCVYLSLFQLQVFWQLLIKNIFLIKIGLFVLSTALNVIRKRLK